MTSSGVLDEDGPGFIPAVLAWPGTVLIGRVLLTLPFWWSGIAKLLDFPGAVAESQGLGLHPAVLIVVATITVQLLGSLSVISGRWRWLGAAALGVFTAFATLLAHGFWTIHDPALRLQQMTTFLEHIGLIGGFVLSAVTLEAPGPGSRR
jgi:transmembrane protein